MKRIIMMFAFIAILGCVSCTPHMKQAKKLIAEYTEKEEAVKAELDASDVAFSDDEWAFVEANAYYWSLRTVVVVGENWHLDVSDFHTAITEAAISADRLIVPLTPEQSDYMHKYNEMCMYSSTKRVLERWVEIQNAKKVNKEDLKTRDI